MSSSDRTHNRRRPSADDADWVLALRGLDGAELPERGAWKETEKPKDPPPPRTMRFGKVRR